MDQDELARGFEERRPHLRAVAYRMLGSVHEADDAVQETWLRLTRAEAEAPGAIDNLGGWLTTVVSRISLDHLRSRGSRREDVVDEHPEVVASAPGPEAEAVLADQVSQALLVVLETLSPAERLAFVLHDLFAVPFEEIAQVTGRSPAAVRQLASRGRRRVQQPETTPQAERRTQRRVVQAFLTASREGDLQGLLDLLDPDAVVRPDGAAIAMGSMGLTTGAAAVAETFSGRARAARLVSIDGYAGAVWSLRGEVKVAFAFTLDGERIVEIELLAEPDVLAVLDVGRR